MKKIKKRITIDDGWNTELFFDATFDGILEMPIVAPNNDIIIPEKVIPFSKINTTTDYNQFVAFYEEDTNFKEILLDFDKTFEKIKKFKGVVSPDFSLYVDSPLACQIGNTFRNRSIAYQLQKRGVYVICNVRWGDERSYTTKYLPEKFAFLGIPKYSIVSIGTYGCIQTNEEKLLFREGLRAMVDELHPKIILVYGSMKDPIFRELKDKVQFVNYPDWITQKKGKK